MYTVTKDGRKQKLETEIQLSAFLNSGWEEVGGKPPASPEKNDELDTRAQRSAARGRPKAIVAGELPAE